EETAATYTIRYPAQAEKFDTLHNGFDALDFPSQVESTGYVEGPISFVYTGALYGKRDPLPFFRGISKLICRGVIKPGDLRVDFVGDCELVGGHPIRRAIAELGLDAVV